MELNAETRSVNEIFSPNKKYLVPRFQREYSWKEEEIDEFWDDVVQQVRIKAGAVTNDEYFIGCIVLVGEDSKPDYLIVDGQQRLTTLTILLRAIVQRLADLGDQAAASALYKNVIEGTDNDGKPYFKLVNESPKPFFQNELQSITPQGIDTAETEEEQLLQDAYDNFQKKIKNFKLGGLSDLESVKALRQQVLNYLKFILVTAKSEDDAYTIFETLNARGLSLTSVDLIKNWIFKNYSQTHPNDNAKDIWSELRKEVSAFSDLETFFRHYWNSKYSFASDDRLYKSFKDLLKDQKIAPARDFLLELKEASATYRSIGSPKESDWPVQKLKAVFRSLSLLNQYRVTQVRPFLLAILERYKAKVVSQTLLIQCIENIENFHFIFSNLCQDRASGLEGKYARAAKNLHLAGADKAKAKQVIKDLCSYLEKKRPSAQRIADALAALEFTNGVDVNKKTIQTVFAKFERLRHGTSELLVGNFSLEHIEDQSNGEPWCGSLGNLLPLDEDINNKIKPGSTFRVKKKQYEKSSLRVVAEFIKANPSDTWDKAAAEKWLAHISKAIVAATALKSVS
jgi:uncharacterized protein with ParB-like and HNH nuclease domain